MVEQKKSISINPAFLKMGSRKNKTVKREKKQKPIIKPNTIKRDLIKKVKSYQEKIKKEKKQQEKQEQETQGKTEFEDEFNDSLEYLQTLVNKRKEKKKKKINNSIVSNQSNVIHTTTQSIEHSSMNDDIPYGILKNGKKPTYRQYIKKNTSLKHAAEPIKIETNVESLQEFEPRKSNLNEFKENFMLKNKQQSILINPLEPNNNIETNASTSTSISRNTPISTNSFLINKNENKKNPNDCKKLPERYIKKRNITTKRKLGKTGNKIGILVKNNKTRKKIEKDHEVLKTSTLKEVKKHLRNHGLLKIGSSAPPEILRKIYEDSFLTGDVYNKNSGVLIHNYLNEDQEE